MSIVFRASKNVDVKRSSREKLAMTSESNQWKIHISGERVATSNNQVFTIEHGLGYTPLFIAFIKYVANTYYSALTVGGSTYTDSSKLSLQTSSIGDKVSFIIFKDFGA